MLLIFPKSFLKSFSRLENPWTSRSFGGFGFRIGLLFPCLADRPRGVRGLSAWSSSSRCSSCSSRVLECFGFDPVGQLLLTGGCLVDRPPGRRGLSAWHELLADCPRGTSCSRTVQGRGTDHLRVEVPVGSFCSCLTDSPPWVADRPHGDRRTSAPGPRTVR
jgi:hypothetical protein